MFSNSYNKTAFGNPSTSSAFGFGTNTAPNAVPFGQAQQFGKSTTTPGFGSTTPLFGNAPQPTSAPLFSSNTAFGTTQPTGFGTGLFGQQQTTGTNALFSNSTVPSFGQQNKASTFGFGGSTPSTLFGQQQSQTFQPANTSGVFGSTPAFTGMGTQMGTVAKFNPVTGTDTMQKNGVMHSINTKHHCITCMKEYENKSFEELRFEDYQCNRKSAQQQSGFGASPFGAPATSAPLFGPTENKSAFAQPSTSFGTASTPFGAQQPLFGKPTGVFGATPTTNAFGFNANTSFGVNNTAKSFAAPTTQNVFSTPATQQQPAFGTNLFAPANSQPNSSGIFGAKTSSFATQPVYTFGQGNAFQAPKTTPAFGNSFTQPTFTSNTGFSQPTNNMFSQVQSNPFTNLQKPTTQPAFAQAQQPGFMGAQSTNNSFFGNNNKPLFGTNTTGTFFGNNSGFMMPQQQVTAPINAAGIDTQQQIQDFNKTVEQIYDLFPRQTFLLDIGTTHDTTNPAEIKDILETESPLTSTSQSKLRIIPKATHFVSSINYHKQVLLGDLPMEKVNSSLSPFSKNGRRLYLRKSTSHKSNETNADCSLSIIQGMKPDESMQVVGTKNKTNMFKNIQTLQNVLEKEIKMASLSIHNENYNDAYFAKQVPRMKVLDLPQDMTYEEEYLQEISILSNRVKSLSSTNSPPVSQKKPEELMKQFDEMDSPSVVRKQQNKTNEKYIAPPQLLKPGLSMSETIITDLTKKIGSPDLSDLSSVETSILNKGVKSKVGKTVRFIDDDNEDSESCSSPRGVFTSPMTENKVAVTDIPINTENNSQTCGVKLTRQEYYTLPPLTDLTKYKDENGNCLIKGFTIGRTGYGNIYFPDQIDISNMNLDDIIHFRFREVQVYPEEDKKPPVGQGLNRRAQVTLDRIWPKGYQPGKSHSLDSSAITRLIDRLCLLSEKQNAKFLDYRPETGSWVFNVEHFSKYTYCDEDDEAPVPPKNDATKLRREIIVDDNSLFSKEVSNDYIKRDLGGINLKDSSFEKLPSVSNQTPWSGKLDEMIDFSSGKIKLKSIDHGSGDNQLAGMTSNELLTKRLPGYKYMHIFKDLEEIKQLDEQSQLHDIQQLEDLDHYDSINNLHGMNDLVLVDEALYEDDMLPSKLNDQRDNNDSFFMRTSVLEDDTLSDFSSNEMDVSHLAFPAASRSSFQPKLKLHQNTYSAEPINPVIENFEYFTTKNLEQDVPSNKSLLCSRPSKDKEHKIIHRNFKDAAIYKGKTFRIGWTEGFSSVLMSDSSTLDEDASSNSINISDKMVSKIKFDSLYDSFSKIKLDEHLKIVCEESVVSIDTEGVPLFTIKKGCRSIVRHNYISEASDKELNNGNMSYFTEVWSLCLAFWGPNTKTPTERLELFIKWLDSATISCAKPDLESNDKTVLQKLFAYLTVHKIEEAARLAINEKLPTLALLISQCSSNDSSKQLMRSQLKEWQINKVTKHMDRTLLKIYMLLAGEAIMSDVNVCENLDWKRALGIHVWYMAAPGTSLISGIQSYSKAYTELNYARKPIPNHCDYDGDIADLEYHIMTLFQNRVTSLHDVLNPLTYCKNYMDYRLSWLLYQALVALSVGSLPEESANYIHMSFSTQLEDIGMWKWAIFVLLFIKDSNIKKEAVMGILYRNMNVDRSSKANLEVEDSLVKDFHLSPKWLHLVLANKTELMNAPIEAYKHLTLLGDWDKAHDMAMMQVIPKLITSGQIEELLSMLRSLVPGSGEILTWDEDVGLIVEFLELRHQLIARRNDVTEFELQQAGSRLIQLCIQVKKINTKTIFQSLAITEITRFISELLMILFKEIEPRKLSTLSDISTKLQALIMPPDYKHKDLLRYFDNYVNIPN